MAPPRSAHTHTHTHTHKEELKEMHCSDLKTSDILLEAIKCPGINQNGNGGGEDIYTYTR